MNLRHPTWLRGSLADQELAYGRSPPPGEGWLPWDSRTEHSPGLFPGRWSTEDPSLPIPNFPDYWPISGVYIGEHHTGDGTPCMACWAAQAFGWRYIFLYVPRATAWHLRPKKRQAEFERTHSVPCDLATSHEFIKLHAARGNAP